MKDDQDQFDFSGDKKPHEMVCPQCQGKGKVPYTPKPSIVTRPDDPVTSHDAGQKFEDKDKGRFTARSFKGKVLTLFAENSDRNFTREEAANEVAPRDIDPGKFETVRKRVSELVDPDVGYLKKIYGEDGKPLTRCNPWSTKESEILTVDGLGNSAFRHMKETGHTR